MMKQAVRRLAGSLGYTVLPRWRLEHFGLARKLQDLFAQFEINTVVDVGANEGQYRDFLRHEVGFEGRIISYEPIPDLAQRLRTRATAEPTWTIRQMALGAAAGSADINVMAGTDFSSFLAPKEVDHYSQNKLNTVARTVTVPVTTLDEELSSYPDLGRTYIKLDTQGFDLEVLKGGRWVMAQIPALQTEISFKPFYEGMPGYADSIAAFSEHGFVVADFFLVTADTKMRAAEFDCLMVRG